MDWNRFSSGKYSPQSQPKSNCTMSSQFAQILANQHNKVFHIIDHPDLVFELAKYNFTSTQSDLTKSLSNPTIPQIQNLPKPKSTQTRKFHRHKSQQQLNNFDDTDLEPLLDSKVNNTPLLVSLNSNKFSTPSLKKSRQFQKQLNMKKTNFQRQSIATQKQDSNIRISINRNPLERHSNPTQIQILKSSKIPTVNNRPLTSQQSIFYEKAKQKQLQQSKKSWKQNFQRRKYADLKSKLQGLIGEIQSCQQLKFSQVFQYEQMILRDYLSSLVNEMKKQCMEKGQLIEMIWNSFFGLINNVMKLMINEKKSVEKSQVQQQLNLHSSYQQMYLFESTKIKELGKKYNESKNVIDRLIYQLRYKRKQVKKLSKTLAILNEKLNQYKVQHIDLQNDHIDLLIDAKQINRDEATQVLKRKIQVNRIKYKRERIGLTKYQLREAIEIQLENQRLTPQQLEMFKRELFAKINENAPKNKKKITPNEDKQQTHIIEEFIQQFSIKHIEIIEQNNQGEGNKSIRKHHKAHTAINTEIFTDKCQMNSALTQTSFSDKIEFDIINNRSTQTPGMQKIKKLETVATQADGDSMKLLYTRNKMRLYRTFDHSFYFQINKNSKFLSRKSSHLYKKQSNNKSISELSSDGSDMNKSPNKQQNKSSKKSIFDKKTSILNTTVSNYSNFRNSSKNKIDSKNINKKRTTEIPHVEHMKTQQNEPRRQSKEKKRTYQTPSTFKQKSGNLVSTCANLDSNSGNISINEEKEKYIENFIMNKEQQFEVLHQNAIMQTYKNYLKQKDKKSLFSNNQKKKIRISQSIEEQIKIKNLDSSESSLPENKEVLTSFGKLKEQNSQNNVKRNSKQGQGLSPFNFSLMKLSTENPQNQPNIISQQYFLNKIIEFTVKKSLIKKKIDSSNFILCKQKAQFLSITEKLDPFMLDVEYLMTQNFNRKRKPNLINFKSVNKFIMMTYSRSIDKMYRNNALLQNLIRPLYECFQMTYGALKPQQIYKKMVSAISDILSVKQNDNFKEFIFFLGLDKESSYSSYLTTFDVCLYLKLLERLNLGGKFGSQIETLFTSRWKVTTELSKILEEEKLPGEVIFMIESKITSILDKLQEYIIEKIESQSQCKINLFKVSKIIIQEVIKIRINALNRLSTLMGVQPTENKQKITLQNLESIQIVKSSYMDCKMVKKVVDCCRISTAKKLYLNKILEELGVKGEENEKRIKKSELGILLIRIGLVDFSELESRVKIVEEFGSTQSLGGEEQSERVQKGIQKLSKVEMESNRILHQILGQVQTLHEMGLLRSLQSMGRW